MAAFRFLCLYFLLPFTGLSQIPYTFQVNVEQEVVTGETDVTHPILDIGSINDVFDGNTDYIGSNCCNQSNGYHP